MKKAWKIAALSAAVLLVGFCLWVYSSFNGNPIGAWLARRAMEQHLAATYPDKQFHFQEIRYDFKSHRYEARFIEGSSHPFEISGNWRRVWYDEYRYTYAMDKTLADRFTEQLESALEALLKERFPQLDAVYASIYVARGAYPADAQFQKGMERETDLEIALVGEDAPAADFAAACLEMRDAILREGYDPISMRFILNDVNNPKNMKDKGGMLLYTLKIERSAYHAALAELLPQVEAYNLQHRGQ